jgi:AcrR family transcriptional regulator
MARLGLNRSLVIGTASKMADRNGLDTISIASLAAELNVKPPSLYNHIESIDAVLDELTLLSARQLLEHSREAIMGRSGEAAIRSLAESQRVYAKKHPALYFASLRSLHGRGEKMESIANEYLSVFLAVLREYGFEGSDALHIVRCLRAAVTGFIQLELRGGFGLPLDSEESFQCLIDFLILGIQAKVQARNRT